jgi:hypothetical protein
VGQRSELLPGAVAAAGILADVVVYRELRRSGGILFMALRTAIAKPVADTHDEDDAADHDERECARRHSRHLRDRERECVPAGCCPLSLPSLLLLLIREHPAGRR